MIGKSTKVPPNKHVKCNNSGGKMDYLLVAILSVPILISVIAFGMSFVLSD